MTNILLELQSRQWRQVEGWNVRHLSEYFEDRALLRLRKSWSCRDVVKDKQSTLAIAYSCDGCFMASSHLTHEIVIQETQPCLHVVRTLSAHPTTNRSPWCLAFHPSLPTHLLSGCLGGSVLLWNVQTGECMCAWLSGISSPISGLVFVPMHPDHFLVAYDTRLCLMHHRGGRMETVWSTSTASVEAKVRLVVHHPDYNKILVAITDNYVLSSYMSLGRSSYRLQMYTYSFSNPPDLENSSEGLLCMSSRVLSPQSVVLTSHCIICTSMADNWTRTKLSIFSILPHNFGQCLHSAKLVPLDTSVVSLDLSPCQRFLLLGLSGKRVLYHMRLHNSVVLSPALKVFRIKEDASSLVLEPWFQLNGSSFINTARWLPLQSGEGGVCMGTQQGSVVRWGGGRRRECNSSRDYQLECFFDVQSDTES